MDGYERILSTTQCCDICDVVKRGTRNTEYGIENCTLVGDSMCGTEDMLYVVMAQCKNAEKENIFVQDVTTHDCHLYRAAVK